MWAVIVAFALAATPDEAVEQVLRGDYASAASTGIALIDAGLVNADVYYNLGNALFKQGDLPGAILAWRRAELLAPRDGDIDANLAHARRSTRDRIELAPQLGVLFWRDSLSPVEQSWGAAIFAALLGALMLLRRARPDANIAIPGLLCAVPAVLLTISTVAELRELAETPGGVVQAERVEVRSAGAGGVVLFELHAGAEVELRERVAGQVQVALPDGRRGWVAADAVAVVDPWSGWPARADESG